MGAVVSDVALPHPTCRVPLLTRPLLIRSEPTVDDRLPPVRPRSRPLRRLPRRWDGEFQRRSEIATMEPELARQRPDLRDPRRGELSQ